MSRDPVAASVELDDPNFPAAGGMVLAQHIGLEPTDDEPVARQIPADALGFGLDGELLRSGPVWPPVF